MKFLAVIAVITAVLAAALVITVVATETIANYFDPPQNWPGQ